MLMVGTIQHLTTTDKTKILNFCSFNENYPRLKLLPPIDFRTTTSGNPESRDYEFDLQYAQWLLNDPNAFIDLMQIVYSLYQGYDIYLLVSEDITMEQYTQSLLKFIQQRYGYNGYYINSIEDLFNAEDQQISGIGAMNLHDDKERLSLMLEEARQNNSFGGMPYGYV